MEFTVKKHFVYWEDDQRALTHVTHFSFIACVLTKTDEVIPRLDASAFMFTRIWRTSVNKRYVLMSKKWDSHKCVIFFVSYVPYFLCFFVSCWEPLDKLLWGETYRKVMKAISSTTMSHSNDMLFRADCFTNILIKIAALWQHHKRTETIKK